MLGSQLQNCEDIPVSVVRSALPSHGLLPAHTHRQQPAPSTRVSARAASHPLDSGVATGCQITPSESPQALGITAPGASAGS